MNKVPVAEAEASALIKLEVLVANLSLSMERATLLRSGLVFNSSV